tara:strand:- start:286 stop:540 length:255 start_codon:yes stop_codon:yes gene_type:complete
MTRPKIQNICDFCGKEIAIDSQEYSVEFGQKGISQVPARKFVKAKGADMCHPCFLNVCKNGYKPIWKTRKLNDESGKWEEVDEE